MSEHEGRRPERPDEEEPASGIAEPPGPAGAEQRPDPPHHELSNPATDPDQTEWPDPYDKRPDPRGPDEEAETPRGPSTSEPHPQQDIEADPRRFPNQAERP